MYTHHPLSAASMSRARQRVRAAAQTGEGLQLIACPECDLPAEVIEYGTAASTDGQVTIIRVLCAGQHWFLMARHHLG